MAKIKEEQKPKSEIKKGIGLGFGGCIGIVIFIIALIIISTIVGSHKKDSSSSSSSSNSTSLTNNSAPAAKTKSYQQIAAFTGSGIKNSEPFTITGDRFKIKYDCAGQLCQAAVKKPATGDQLKDLANTQYFMNTTGNAKDETILYGAGEYYISANTMGTYNMTIEDYK